MHPDEVKQHLQNDTPLDIIMNSGERYHIPNVDYAHISPSGESVVVYDANGHYHRSLATLNISTIKLIRRRGKKAA